ncbi:E3 ubiquitin/ISG15 ligase TRIM25 [Manis javanica]|nr:E3 ubiquitin/ISG15 ligase TRIM25 [Manis javanica]
MGEMLYCPECRESFPSRPHLSKNVNLEEMVTCFTQAKGQTLQSPQKLAGPRDVTCDFCSPQKLEAIKSCLQCMVSLCEQHLHSHFEDPMFQDHQLLDPMWDLKNRLCRKHHKLQQLYCRTEGSCVCGVCLLEEHRNHDTVPLEEECAHKEVEVRKMLANVENQMLIITSNSQKHQEQVAFLSRETIFAEDDTAPSASHSRAVAGPPAVGLPGLRARDRLWVAQAVETAVKP